MFPRSFRAAMSTLSAGRSELLKLDQVRVFVVAGEPSGDAIGGRLIAAMKHLWPLPLRVAGVGGSYMQKEGVKSLFNMDDIAVMGVAELVPHLLTLSGRFNETVKVVEEFDPHVLVTIDSKGFSFRLLKKIKDIYAKAGEPAPLCVHYVAPSFWAWKGGEEKLRNLSTFVDHLLCILPFEEETCKLNGLKATFVGHPVLEDSFDYASGAAAPDLKKWQIQGDGAKFKGDHSLRSASPIITVLPGSRSQELKKMLPIFGSALSHLSQNFPDAAAIVPTVASDALTKMVEVATRDWKIPVTILPGATTEQKYNLFAASDAALATSGTAVMQLQMSRVPSVVAYRANWITESIIQHRTKLRYISLPNILLDSPVLPEALFSSCKPEHLAFLLRQILEDASAREGQSAAAESVLRMMQPSDAAERPSWMAARVILNALEESL